MRNVVLACALAAAFGASAVGTSNLSAQGLAPTSAQSNQLPLAAYAWPVSGLLDNFGPDCPQSSRWLRKAVLDAIDYLSTPQMSIGYIAPLDPNVGPFISILSYARNWALLDKVANEPLPAPGDLVVVKGYSSAWAVKGSNGTKVFFDHSDTPLHPNGWVPNLPDGITTQQLDLAAVQADIAFITHLHSDHMSPYFILQMITNNKPVIVTQEIKDSAVASGAWYATYLTVPQSGVTYNFGNVSFVAYPGIQYMGFLDPANTIPDPSNPYNVQNNAFLVSIDGVTVAHFGDNNDPGIVPWVAQMAAQGWTPSVVLQIASFGAQIVSYWAPEMNFRSHYLEFMHLPGGGFHQLEETWFGPDVNDMRLFWGESLTVNDFITNVVGL